MNYATTVPLAPFDSYVALHDTFVRAFSAASLRDRVILQLATTIKPNKPIQAGDTLTINGYNVGILSVNPPAPGQNPGIYVTLDTGALKGKPGAVVIRALSQIYNIQVTSVLGAGSMTPVAITTPPPTVPDVTPVDFAWNVQQIGNTALKVAAAVAVVVVIYYVVKHYV